MTPAGRSPASCTIGPGSPPASSAPGTAGGRCSGTRCAELVSGAEPFDPPAWFGRTAPLVLEIGSGMGETTVALAAAAPDVDHLAVEVFEPGLAQLLMRITEAGLRNVVPLRGDAVALLRRAGAAGLAGRDPGLLPRPVAQAAAPQAAADPARASWRWRRVGCGPAARCTWPPTGQTTPLQMREVCDAEPMLDNAAGQARDGWAQRPEWRPVTKFEQRARAEGRPVAIYVPPLADLMTTA